MQINYSDYLSTYWFLNDSLNVVHKENEICRSFVLQSLIVLRLEQVEMVLFALEFVLSQKIW